MPEILFFEDVREVHMGEREIEERIELCEYDADDIGYTGDL